MRERVAPARACGGVVRGVAAAAALVAAACADVTPRGATPPDAGPGPCSVDEDCPEHSVCMAGVCTPTDALPDGGTPDAGHALIVPEPAAVDFGAVQVGSVVQARVRFFNRGSAADRLNAVAFFPVGRGAGGPDEYALGHALALPARLDPGGAAFEVELTYAPEDAGADTGTLVASFSESGNVEVPVSSDLKGDAALAVVDDVARARAELAAHVPPTERDTLAFGELPVGTEAVVRRLFVVNAGNGNAPLVVRAVRTDPPASPHFSLTVQPATPLPETPVFLPVLGAAAEVAIESLEVAVRLTPLGACHDATVLLVVTDAEPSPRRIALDARILPSAADDADGDRLADACDACPFDRDNDTDRDGVCGNRDLCPGAADPMQLDGDGDGRGDACDRCPLDPEDDADADGVCGDADNCDHVANADQTDRDADEAGDACDACPRHPDDDEDGDGVCGDIDNCPLRINPDQGDRDRDGTGDACDPCPEGPNLDSDRDGRGDACDNCPALANADQSDADADGAGDACDPCPRDGADDADRDGVCGDADNCPAVADPTLVDRDGDGLGDACDACAGDPANDVDRDGACGDVDNCPNDTNRTQVDRDGDGAGDACDGCPLDAADDRDGDGFCGDVDNCPAHPNVDQLDGDHDARGDVCDLCALDPDNDVDGDGLCAELDNCAFEANLDQTDADADGLGDACDPCPRHADSTDGDGDGVGDACDTCARVPDADQRDTDGDGLGDACDANPFDVDMVIEVQGIAVGGGLAAEGDLDVHAIAGGQSGPRMSPDDGLEMHPGFVPAAAQP